ncbi:MAG: hypothetical protein JJV98_20260 [Desulfosarcina sp.]|nr:hypothetical protein [Desulfobacterales bacterium]
MYPLIDHYLPVYQFRERHAITVRRRPETVLAATMTCDLGQSALVRTLFKLRGLPAGNITLEGMQAVGFRILDQRPGHELVIGLIGRFWTYSGGIHRFAPEQFATLQRPGLAKAATNFRVEAPAGGFTRLSTETRIWCSSPSSRQRFGFYWFLIRPFSGLVRIEWLRLIKRHAEAAVIRTEGVTTGRPEAMLREYGPGPQP